MVFDGTEVDELENVIDSWAAPVEVMVFGWEPPVSSEPLLAGHDRVVVDLKLYGPRSFSVVPRDRVVVDGRLFEVVGYPQDPNFNPWWQPGLVTILLKRIEG